MYTANERIRDYRSILLKISQEEFAEAVGIEYTRLRKIEAKKIKATLKDVVAVADAYNEGTDYFLGRRQLPLKLDATEGDAKLRAMLESLSPTEVVELYQELNKTMEPDEVTTICYGKEEKWKSRDVAKDFFLKAMAGSEGSEHERYSNIYVQLSMGEKICRDEVDDDGEN